MPIKFLFIRIYDVINVLLCKCGVINLSFSKHIESQDNKNICKTLFRKNRQNEGLCKKKKKERNTVNNVTWHICFLLRRLSVVQFQDITNGETRGPRWHFHTLEQSATKKKTKEIVKKKLYIIFISYLTATKANFSGAFFCY